MVKKKISAKKNVPDENALGKAGMALGIAGLLFFLFGLMLFINPATTLSAAVFVFGLVMLVAGLLKVYEGLVVCKGAEFAGFITCMGVLTAVVGVIMLTMPDAVTGGVLITFSLLALLFAVIALFTGIWQIAYAIKKSGQRMMPLIGGIICVLLGIVMLFNPFAAALAIVSLMGFFAMIYGALIIAFAWYVGSLA